MENESDRLAEMVECNERSGDMIRKLQTMHQRIKNIKKQTVAQIEGELQKINFDPNDRSGWEKVANLFKSNAVKNQKGAGRSKLNSTVIDSPSQSFLMGSR